MVKLEDILDRDDIPQDVKDAIREEFFGRKRIGEETAWKQSTDIIVEGKKAGTVEVCFLEGMPETYEESFLKEEMHLIKALSMAIGKSYELKQTEKALQQQRDWLEVTLSSIGDAVIATDINAKITFINPMAEELTGWTAQEALGRNIAEVFHIINEQTRQSVENPIDRVLKEGLVVGMANHTVLIARDGRKTPIDDSSAPIRSKEGVLLGVVLVFRDITERKQAERAMQEVREYAENIVETVREPLVVLDAELHVVSANRAFYQTFQVAVEETENRMLYDLGNRQWDIPQLRELLEKILPQNAFLEAFEVEHAFETIGPKTMLLNARQIKRETNQVQLILLAIEDITERKQAEEKLKKHSEQLEEMVEERTKELRKAHEELIHKEKMAVLGQLAGGVSHELRNPLGAIKNAVYFLNMVLEKPDHETKESLDIIQEEVTTSERIINSILDFAHPKPLSLHIICINNVIQKVLSRASVPENIEIVTHLDEALPSFQADPDKLNLAFGNIIFNAIQAMPQGGQLIIKSELPSPDWVVISFTDTGVGIPEANLEKIFEPLFTTKAKGIGLGLAVSKTLIENHAGSIEVQSEVGKGSTFTIRLPIRRMEEERLGGKIKDPDSG